MQKIICTFFLILMSLYASAQQIGPFEPQAALPTDVAARPAQTGIGFDDNTIFENSLGTNPTDSSRFVVTKGLMGHYQFGSGLFGRFTDNSTWSALGPSGGMSSGSAYGLILKDDSQTGVFNLIDNGSNNKDLVVGWGKVTGRNESYFKINSFQDFAPKTVMFANPRGAIGVNAEPLSAIYVDTREGLLVPETENNFGGWPGTGQLFKAITIENDQRLQSNDLISSASSIGKQGNSSLIDTDVVVEG